MSDSTVEMVMITFPAALVCSTEYVPLRRDININGPWMPHSEGCVYYGCGLISGHYLCCTRSCVNILFVSDHTISYDIISSHVISHDVISQ